MVSAPIAVEHVGRDFVHHLSSARKNFTQPTRASTGIFEPAKRFMMIEQQEKKFPNKKGNKESIVLFNWLRTFGTTSIWSICSDHGAQSHSPIPLQSVRCHHIDIRKKQHRAQIKLPRDITSCRYVSIPSKMLLHPLACRDCNLDADVKCVNRKAIHSLD
jgi:hypothetical protein